MGRREAGVYKPRAGLDLIHEARTAGLTAPIFVYSSARGVERECRAGNSETAIDSVRVKMLRSDDVLIPAKIGGAHDGKRAEGKIDCRSKR